jgi:hypothetical protein
MHLSESHLRKEKVLQGTCSNHNIEAFIQEGEVMDVSTNEAIGALAYGMTDCSKGYIHTPIVYPLLQGYSIGSVATSDIEDPAVGCNELEGSLTLFCIDVTTFPKILEIGLVGIPKVN